MKAYLEAVVAEKIPANDQILYNRAIFSLMPNSIKMRSGSTLVKTGDYHLAVYCASGPMHHRLHELEQQDPEQAEEEEEAKAEEKKTRTKGRGGQEGRQGQGGGGPRRRRKA